MGLALLSTLCWPLQADTTTVRTEFKVKYVAEGAVYLDGGREAGLSEGHKLTITRQAAGSSPVILAQLTVVSVASTSAVCEITTASGEVAIGDVASLVEADAQALKSKQAADESLKYTQVVTFTEGNPLEEEGGRHLPRPQLP